MGKNKKSFFLDDWLNEPVFNHIKPSSKGKTFAYCKLCDKDFYLSNMGRCAVESHIKGLKHSRKLNVQESSYGICLFTVSQNQVNFEITYFCIEHFFKITKCRITTTGFKLPCFFHLIFFVELLYYY